MVGPSEQTRRLNNAQKSRVFATIRCRKLRILVMMIVCDFRPLLYVTQKDWLDANQLNTNRTHLIAINYHVKPCVGWLLGEGCVVYPHSICYFKLWLWYQYIIWNDNTDPLSEYHAGVDRTNSLGKSVSMRVQI